MSDPWNPLRRYTQARIGLGRAGHALPTGALLDFQLAHAQARDAVHLPWDIDAYADEVRRLGAECLVLETPVADRGEYLRRPDLGRRLTEASRAHLAGCSGEGCDIALAVTNGLSSTAVERHGLALLAAILARYRARGLRVGPVCAVANGRVALSDEIGAALKARLAVMVVGERPGLSAADSLGIYLTYAPGPGNTDAERNCLSNIRPPEGLDYPAAADKLAYLTGEALRRGLSGVGLKDEMALLPEAGPASGGFIGP
jgi:ethanolamine ammonia-lyase small subunit